MCVHTYRDIVLSLVHETDGETGFFDSGVNGTPAEIDPAAHVFDVGGDLTAVDPFQGSEEEQEREEKAGHGSKTYERSELS